MNEIVVLDWDFATFIGEELDDSIRNRLTQLEKEYGQEFTIEGGYEIIPHNLDDSEPESIDIYFEIKKNVEKNK